MTRIHLRTRHVMCLRLNTDSRSQNNCCPGKAGSITYFECVTVVLASQHANRMSYYISSVAYASNIFFILSH
jgi:hypothetical protein